MSCSGGITLARLFKRFATNRMIKTVWQFKEAPFSRLVGFSVIFAQIECPFGRYASKTEILDVLW
jgi:hypothetical protein